MMKLDEAVVARILGDFAVLIKSAAESQERGRFSAIQSLARQAMDFQLSSVNRLSDYDALSDPDGGIVMGGGGQAVRLGGFGDQAEMYRTLIDSLKDMANKRTAVSPAVELNELLAVRRSLKEDGETTEDIDARIKTLRREIADGHTSTVVHPQLLRGSETGTIGDGNEPVLGECHPDGAEGAAEPPRARSDEGLGEGHGARSNEGIPRPVD
jgi:hypothetical protein